MEPSTFTVRVIVCTLAAVIISAVLTLLVGLFFEQVDNKEIFRVLGPALQTTLGGFVGFLGGLATGQKQKKIAEEGA